MLSGLRKKGAFIALLFAFALVAASCGDDASTTTTTAAGGTDAPPPTTAAEAIKTCLVTDLAGVDDRSFNASAWQGVQDAVAAGYATEDSFFLESADASDWQPNIDQMVSQGCQHIVTVGFALGEVTAINAQAQPDIIWTMIDNVLTDADFAPLGLPNVRELVYQTDQAAFGHRVVELAEVAQVGARGHVHDRRSFGEEWFERRGQAVHGSEVDRQHCLERLVCHVDESGIAGDPGVVHQALERPGVTDRGNHGFETLVCRQVGLNR